MRPFILKQLPRNSLNVASRALHSTSFFHHDPLPAQPLEPSLQQLLKDADLSLLRRGRNKKASRSRARLELDYDLVEEVEAVPDAGKIVTMLDTEDVPDVGGRHPRRSPEASFGLKRIGMVTIPWELESSMTGVIEGSGSC